MTYASNVSKASHNIAFFVEIDGIPVRFSERWLDLSDVLSDSVAQFEMPSIVAGSISPGFGRLDRDARRQIGGTFSFRVRDLGFAYDNSKTANTFYALSSYIRPRARQTTTIAATMSDTATSASVLSGSDIANGDFLYSGQETLSVSSGGGTTSLTVVRGNFNSRARRIYREAGSTSLKGQKVFKYPQSWRGRRVRLKGAYVASDGTTTSADIATIGTWVMAGPPQYLGNDEWDFQCEDVANLITQFKCYVGLSEVQRGTDSAEEEVYRPSASYEYMLARVCVGLGYDFFQTSSSERMHVQYWTEQDGMGIGRLGAVDTGNENIEIVLGQDYQLVVAKDPTSVNPGGSPVANGAYAPITITAVKPVQYLAGPPGELSLMMMTSVIGDGTNGTYDRLAGRQPDTLFDNGWQFGAGIPSDYINQESFLERGRYSVAPWTLLLSEPLEVGEILREFCAATGSFWFINSDGEVEVSALSEFFDPTQATGLTIDDSVVLRETEDATTIDESLVAPHVRFQAGLDPIVREHMVRGTITDWDVLQRYPFSQGEMSVRMDWVHPVANGFLAKSPMRLKVAAQADALSVYARIHNIQKLRGRALVSHQATCSWEASTLTAGQIVTVTNDNAVDYEGGRLSSDRFLVVEKRIDFERGIVSLDLQALDDAVVWAPAFVVSAVSVAASTTVTVSNAHDSNYDIADAEILEHLVAGVYVDYWDVSGSAWGGSTPVTGVTAASRQFTTANTWAPAVGDIVTLATYDSVADMNVDAGYSLKYDTAFQADGSGLIGTANDTARRWA